MLGECPQAGAGRTPGLPYCILHLRGDFSVYHLPHLQAALFLTPALTAVSSPLQAHHPRPRLQFPVPLTQPHALTFSLALPSLLLSSPSSSFHPLPVSPWPCLLPATLHFHSLSTKSQFLPSQFLLHDNSLASFPFTPAGSPSRAFYPNSLSPLHAVSFYIHLTSAVGCTVPVPPSPP